MKIRTIGLALLLSLVLSTQVNAATRLSASPSPANWGTVVVGSCSLETFVGCNVKTITIKNISHQRVRITAISVSPTGDVGLDPNAAQAGDCTRLPYSGRYWTLRAGRQCTIRVAMAPLTIGAVERTLSLRSPAGSTLISVKLQAIGG